MKTCVRSLTLLLAALLLFSFASCKKTPPDALWESTTYLEDTTLGEGKTTVKVEIKAGEHSITLTIRTDRTILGDALTDLRLIEGEESTYGLYVKKVNGITADYDVDQSYWGFYKNGEYLMTGVDSTTIADGEHYELVYEK